MKGTERQRFKMKRIGNLDFSFSRGEFNYGNQKGSITS
jgi:hypothetical protein